MKFYQLPNSNSFTHRLLFFSREDTSEIYGPWVSSLLYLLCDLFLFAFIFRSINPKTQKYLAAIFIYLFYLVFPRDLFIQSITTFSRQHAISGAIPRKGLTTPLTRRVVSIYYLCACAVYIVLLGSPTGSVTLVSSLTEIPIIVVLHHPFPFGEIPT